VLHRETFDSIHLHLSSSEHKQLFGTKGVGLGIRLFLSQLLQQTRSFGMQTCSPVQFYCSRKLVELQQLFGSFGEQRVYLRLVVTLSNLNSKAPMLQVEARLDS
jgi:hypothetical protein